MACFTNIEGWYNPVWLHAGLGYRSPIIDEAEMPEMLTDTSPAGQQTVHRNGVTSTLELNFTSFTPDIHTITNFDAAIGLDTLSAEAIGSHASLQPHEFLYNGGTATTLSVNAAIVIQRATPDQLLSVNFVLRYRPAATFSHYRIIAGYVRLRLDPSPIHGCISILRRTR